MEDALEAYQKRDYQTAYEIYSLHALRGNSKAQKQLGMMHYWGQGVTRSAKEGASWMRLAAEQGDLNAAHILGVIYSDEKGDSLNYEEAVKWWKVAVEQGKGNPDQLGEFYEKGLGVNQDFKEAIRLYQIGVSKNYHISINHMGRMYEKGQGVPQNYQEAVKRYRKASEKCLKMAHHNLGRMYEQGLGVTKDLVEAYKWYTIALARRAGGKFDRPAISESRENIKKQMTAEQIRKAESQANRWKQKFC